MPNTPTPPPLPSAFAGEVREIIRQGITEATTQAGDDNCWMDLFTRLAALVGIEFNPLMLPRGVMLRNCERYVDSVLAKCPYQADSMTIALREARAENARLQAEVKRLEEYEWMYKELCK